MPSSSTRSDSSDSPRSKDRKRKKQKGKSKRRKDEDSDRELDKRLRDERQRRKEDKLRQKEKLKAQETIEEKRARRLAKKLAKDQKKKQGIGWHEDCLGYTNVDNPFGDPQLTETFVWKKKLEREGLAKAPKEALAKRSVEILEKSRDELEKVKRNRLERERQRAERDQEMEMMQRDKESAQFKEWSKQEDRFHLEQAKLRSKIRIQEGRPKPIDLLARYISVEDGEDMEIEMHESYTYLQGLTGRDLEDLLADVRVYEELEGGKNDDYWRDIRIIAEDEMDKLKRAEQPNLANRREGINESVRRDVANILKGKTYHELALVEVQVLKKLKGDEEGVDVNYWETLLGQLKVYMAKARLRDRHQDTLKRRLFRLKQEQMVEPKPLFPAASSVKTEEDVSASPGPSGVNQPSDSAVAQADESEESSDEEDEIPWEELAEDERRERMVEEYDGGSYSPLLVADDSLEPGTEIVDPVEDRRRLEFSRVKLKASGSATSQLDATLEAEARKGMGGDEAQFSVEAPLERKTYLWSDKYRPRKPRYFNRVHTGFEWNKYNQTHYDLDNPPPKIVQGYKFNIFYPDLLDAGVAPTFELTPCPQETDFAVLKFHAGPPYEDIAFKVVNREWEISHRKGYRCQFQNGIFQLWYHFKKYRYRR